MFVIAEVAQAHVAPHPLKGGRINSIKKEVYVCYR